MRKVVPMRPSGAPAHERRGRLGKCAALKTARAVQAPASRLARWTYVEYMRLLTMPEALRDAAIHYEKFYALVLSGARAKMQSVNLLLSHIESLCAIYNVGQACSRSAL